MFFARRRGGLVVLAAAIVVILVAATALASVGRAATSGNSIASASRPSIIVSTTSGSSSTLLRTTSTTTTTPSSTSTTSGVEGLSHPPLGLIVPLYMDPGPLWTQLITAKDKFPQLQVIAIINPQSGVGDFNATYLSWTKMLQENGITVFGYIDTVFTTTPMGQIQANITDYSRWYAVTGVFIDDMTNTPGGVDYYMQAYQYARAQGLEAFANPGTMTEPQYYAVTADNLMIYEDQGLPSIPLLQNSSMTYPPNDFSFIATGVPVLPSQSYLIQASRFVSWVWITDNGDSYMDMPSYLDQEMSELAGLPYSFE